MIYDDVILYNQSIMSSKHNWQKHHCSFLNAYRGILNFYHDMTKHSWPLGCYNNIHVILAHGVPAATIHNENIHNTPLAIVLFCSCAIS